LGTDAAGFDGSLGRLTGNFGSCTGPIFGSWIPDPDPDPLEPVLPPPERSFAAVPAAAASGLWTAEPAVPVTVLTDEPEPAGLAAGAGPEAPVEPPADAACVEEEAEPDPPPDLAPGRDDLLER
jgi:hypothetical protein